MIFKLKILRFLAHFKLKSDDYKSLIISQAYLSSFEAIRYKQCFCVTIKT